MSGARLMRGQVSSSSLFMRFIYKRLAFFYNRGQMKAIDKIGVGILTGSALIYAVFIRGPPCPVIDAPRPPEVYEVYEYAIPGEIFSGIVEPRPIERKNLDANFSSTQKAPITIVIPY